MFVRTMAGDMDDKELGRRLSAARGYRRESVSSFAARIEHDRMELRRWELGDFGSDARARTQARKRENAVRLIQEASGLPIEFFSIDLAQLPDMVTAWRQVQQEDPDAIRRSLEQDEERTLPGDSNGTRSAGQEP